MIPIIPYSYNDLLNIVKEQLILRGYNAEYDGSNASILADIIAYMLSQVNTNVSYNINERLLTQATQRRHVLEDARELGYESQNRISYQYNITLVAKKDDTLPDNDTTIRVYQVTQYSKFSDGNNTYIYTNETFNKELSNADITDTNNTAKFFNIRVKEGILHLAEDEPDLLQTNIQLSVVNGVLYPSNYISLPYENIEENGIDLLVSYLDTEGILHSQEPWFKTNQFLIDKDSNLTKKYFRMLDFETNTPKIFFNMSGVGTVLNAGSTIKANVIISSGSQGAAGEIRSIVNLTSQGSFEIYNGSDTKYTQKLNVVGQDEEHINSIKVNAPLFHNTANRAVTKSDYISICDRQLSIHQSQIWGGEEEVPINPIEKNERPLGHIWFSFIPSYVTNTFSHDILFNNYTLDNVDDELEIYIKDQEVLSVDYDPFGKVLNPGVFDLLQEYKIITLQFHYRHPIYIDFEYDISVVKYNLQDDKQKLQNTIFETIRTYFVDYIEAFQVEYFNSNLIKRIDRDLKDLSGLEVKVTNYIPVFPQNLYNESIYPSEYRVTIFLATPYEQFIDDTTGFLKTNIMPSINTSDFISTGVNLTVDWSPYASFDISGLKEFSADIVYNGTVSGKYFVSNSYVKFIRIDLWVLNDGGTAVNGGYYTTSLRKSMFQEVRRLNLKYSTNNFRTYKNTRCRLTRVSF